MHEAMLPSGSLILNLNIQYLLIATVRASGELAQGQMTSCLRPLLWKTLRNASQEEIDPGVKRKSDINIRSICNKQCFQDKNRAIMSRKWQKDLTDSLQREINLLPA